jgi:hypothetical protein
MRHVPPLSTRDVNRDADRIRNQSLADVLISWLSRILSSASLVSVTKGDIATFCPRAGNAVEANAAHSVIHRRQD